MLCSFGSFPLSVAVSGVLVRHLGPALFFPVAGGLVAVAILGGLTQREFRVVRGDREHEGPGRVSRNGGNAGGGLKPGPVRHKENAR